ncbi:U3 small nucleolar ribonucleoprotein [Trichuris trichiura]|uniref:U3 small nucleolar ribonucleoprotein n=1 Tax=Trichuris trichiura TaxID=36087 RepID=A0A077ZC45_TRITR|nr:U3 small nucleolar ribonucleoprotein [Trichuris trichiura]
MYRRQARLRREYIYRKSIEAKEKVLLEKKERVKNALEEGKRIPTELQSDALELLQQSEWLDEGGEGIVSHVDDEYRWAGVTDPKIVLTTSHNPSTKLKQFAKEMRIFFPGCQRINRGQYEMKKLVEACRANDVTDFILLQENRGVPDGITICHLPFGPTAFFTLSNVVMRHDVPNIGTMSEQYPHLIFNGFTSKLGKRIMNILKYLFPVPKEDSKRLVTFAVEEDYISFRHHVYKQEGSNIVLTEMGPRFEMKPYCIKLGTVDTLDAAETEWILRPYMNSTRKRLFLSAAADS